MIFVEAENIRSETLHLLVRNGEEFGIGMESDIVRLRSTSPLPVLYLSLEDILGRGEPENALVGMICGVLKANEALSCSCRMDDASLMFRIQHCAELFISFLIVRI